jgi:hypothetical protein
LVGLDGLVIQQEKIIVLGIYFVKNRQKKLNFMEDYNNGKYKKYG